MFPDLASAAHVDSHLHHPFGKVAITQDTQEVNFVETHEYTQRAPAYTCIALMGHLKPTKVAKATMDSAATAVESWNVKKFLIL